MTPMTASAGSAQAKYSKLSASQGNMPTKQDARVRSVTEPDDTAIRSILSRVPVRLIWAISPIHNDHCHRFARPRF
ncbi:MAG: hypothetical protein NT113_25490 [Hyphomicrobiales bacterium]|nr:hypothetical protein [Hyphomicrobiales bacterium]